MNASVNLWFTVDNMIRLDSHVVCAYIGELSVVYDQLKLYCLQYYKMIIVKVLYRIK